MKKYRSENAVFLDEIDIMENDDDVLAEGVTDVPIKQIFENTLVLKGSLSGIYAFADQILAAAYLSYQRLSNIMAFRYDAEAERITNWGSSSICDDTIIIMESLGKYDENSETIFLTGDSDFDFGADGFMYNQSKEVLISPTGNTLNDETYVFGDGQAGYSDEIITLLSAAGIPVFGGGSGGR